MAPIFCTREVKAPISPLRQVWPALGPRTEKLTRWSCVSRLKGMPSSLSQELEESND